MKKHYTILLLLLILTGCFKGKPDVPPDLTGQDPDIQPTLTIAQLKNLPEGIALGAEHIISGIVVMNDQSGNYFRKLVIQDGTGGIEIELAQNYLYTDFSIGRRVFVHCQDLFLGNQFGMKQLGYRPDPNGRVTPIPTPLIAQFLTPGKFPVSITPDTFRIDQLSDPDWAARWLNCLIALKDVEFADSNKAVRYAQPPEDLSTTTRTIIDCNGSSLTLRTSGYANFSALLTPKNKGTIQAIYTRFYETPQLYIRDTNDVNFREADCKISPSIGDHITITRLRQFYNGQTVSLNSYQISGIVISDRSHGNTSPQTFILQGGVNDAGIQIRLNASNPFDLGDSVSLNTQNAVLINEYGTLSLQNIHPSQITRHKSNKTLTPKAITISALQKFPKSFESQLVRINNISWIQPLGRFGDQSGNLLFKDDRDTLIHFAETTADFIQNSPGASSMHYIQGIVFLRNNRVFIKMRHPSFDLAY